MRTVFIENLQNGQTVADVWAVKECEEKTGKSGDFLCFEFLDRTGTIKGRHFKPTPSQCEAACDMEFAFVRGVVDPHWGLNLLEFPRPVVVPDDLAPFLPASPVSLADLTRRFDTLLAQVTEPQLSALLSKIFAPGSPSRARFCEAPAAVRNHHAFLHGLLHHSVEVAEMALAMHDVCPGSQGEPFRRDLLLAGALLHDIGKTREIAGNASHYRFSTSGRLLGHTSLGMMRVSGASAKIVAPPLLELLLNLIASHHGSHEWGAPALPLSREALILHKADALSVELFYADEAHRKAAKCAPKDDFQDAALLPAKRIFVGDYGFAAPATTEIPAETAWRLVCPWRSESDFPIFASPSANHFATVRLPLLARVAAGPGVYADADVNGHFPVCAWADHVTAQSHYLLRVSGDSMTRTGIGDDDLLVVEPARHADHGDIVVATLPDGGVTVKRLDKSGKHGPTLHAESLDSIYPSPFVVPGTAFRIEGVALGVLTASA